MIATTHLHEGDAAEAIGRLKILYESTRALRGVLRVEIISALARAYLVKGTPLEAIPLLIEATRNRIRSDGWEVAKYNLGLAWWHLGHYSNAVAHWQDATEHLRNAVLKRHAHVGLGNAAMRDSDPRLARYHYKKALELYERTSSSRVNMALNNIATSYIQEKRWTEARRALMAMMVPPEALDALMAGQIFATRAEIAWAIGDIEEFRTCAHKAKNFLGDVPVSSWFLIRFLELQAEPAAKQHLVDEISDQLGNVKDPLLALSLRVKVLRMSP